MSVGEFRKYLVAALIIFSVIAFGQTKLYVVINEADWCKYCKANGERVQKTIQEYSKGKDIIIVRNNVTSDETRNAQNKQFQKLGILEYMNRHKEAAMIFVFNSKSKKILDGFSIKKEDEEIVKALSKALSSVTN